MKGDLEIRKTHRYVGTCKHLDEHERIGSYEVLKSTDRTDHKDDEFDPCDPRLVVHVIVVTSTAAREQIEQALKDTFSQWDCAHEYDCCGCRSYRVTSIEPLNWQPFATDSLWRVSVASSRNY